MKKIGFYNLATFYIMILNPAGDNTIIDRIEEFEF
jgi:hypothetical protein